MNFKVNEISIQTQPDCINYEFNLGNFSGSIDLLLNMIKKNKIKIEDIFISNITEQFLEFLTDLNNINMDNAADFINTAALLIELKSRSLLPKEIECENNNLSEQEMFIQKLEEYNLLKERTEELIKKGIAKNYYRPQTKIKNEIKIIKDLDYNSLINSLNVFFNNLSLKFKFNQEKKIYKEQITLYDQITRIKNIVNLKNCISFNDIINNTFEYKELIVTSFSAILELCKKQDIKLKQEKIFDEILIIKNTE